MEAPKALLDLAGRSVIAHVIDRLRALVSKTYLVVNEPDSYRFLGLPLVQDVEPFQGPLVGLYSGLKACRAPWVLVVACDTPFLEPGLLQLLLTGPRAGLILLPVAEGEPQPFPGLYSARCTGPIEELLKAGRKAMRDFIAATPHSVMDEPEVRRLDPELRSFFSLNTRDDYRRAQQLLATTKPRNAGSGHGGEDAP